jgi:hypothetical protein
MSFLKKIFPFLFKSEANAPAAATPAKPNAQRSGASRGAAGAGNATDATAAPVVISDYGIIARVKNARGLRKDSKVYVRAIMEDEDRLRVRGTAPNGKKVTLTVPRRSLKEYESEGVPEHIAKHYDRHSLFKEEHEAKMKAEALGKH